MTASPPKATTEDHLEDFASLEADWHQVLARSSARHIFSTGAWGRSWWQSLGAGELHLLSVRQSGSVIGVAPLVQEGDTLRLLGDKEVCDYLDVVALPGAEPAVAAALLRFAGERSCSLDLQPLLPDSMAVTYLIPLAGQLGCTARVEPIDVSYRMPLPSSFEEYLDSLNSKDRHELRRKFRRLDRAGHADFCASGGNPADMDDFFRLFRTSRSDKDRFMTPQREAFFRSLARETAKQGWLRLYFLELEHKRVAAAFCFNYNETLYLYNSGFEPSYQELAVGLLCKALSIRAATLEGKKEYDFLRGAEDYKSHLGGAPTPVYRCIIVTQPGKSCPSEASG